MVAHRFEPRMKLELFLRDFALMLAEGRELRPGGRVMRPLAAPL